MTRVTMLTPVSGTRDGEDWPPVGGTVDVPDAEAADLVAAGLAEPAKKAPAKKAAPKARETADAVRPDAEAR